MNTDPSNLLTTIGPALVRIWGFDGTTQRWRVYDPMVPALSDLTSLVQGQGYWVKVTIPVTLIVGGYSYALQAGWNLIGWRGL